MATSLAFTNSFDVTDAASFIPEVWSDDVIAGYKKHLVLANLVSKINHKGKKGDTIHLPAPVRGSASAKAANNVVTLVSASATTVDVVIDQHYEYSFVVEDIVETQGLASMRRFYTDDAGYALATQVDTALRNLAATWNSGTAYSGAVIGSDGSTAYSGAGAGNGAALSDAGLRRVIQTLDDNDVPMRDRFLVIPPVEKRRLLGITRFTEQAFTGEAGSGNSIRNGLVGDLYGIPVYASTNIATIESLNSIPYRACLLFQKDSLVLAEQMGVRTQAQYKQEALGTLVTADRLYGVKTVRAEGARAIIVPSA
jgi:N4-gp56 family major capsid protein